MPGMRRRRKIEKNVKVKYCPIMFGWLVCFLGVLMHNRNKIKTTVLSDCVPGGFVV